MAIFPNVYVAMVMISSMGIISMSISYCPYALLGQYHEIKEVRTQTDSTHTSMHTLCPHTLKHEMEHVLHTRHVTYKQKASIF